MKVYYSCLLIFFHALILCILVTPWTRNFQVQSRRIWWPYRQSVLLQAKKSASEKVIIRPEFSRILNIAQISPSKEVQCRLLAKPSEREGLAQRFRIDALSYFAANVTVYRDSLTSVAVTGTLEAHMPLPMRAEPDVVRADFETKLVWSGGGAGAPRLEDADDYDDEAAPNGDVDIGEIAAQYLSLELI